MGTLKDKIWTAGRLYLIIGATLTLQVLSASPLFAKTGKASWYSTEACKYNPDPKCPTANGRSLYELEKNKVLFAASWDYKFGTKLLVTNIKNGKSVVVEVLDRGPAKRLHRIIDLGKEAFSRIGDCKRGLIEVELREV